VLGVLAVGGVVYFAGKSSAPKNEVSDNSNYYPPVEQNQNPPTTNNNPPAQTPPPSNNPPVVNNQPPTTTPCKPSITLLSPNGGEVYQAGQQVTIKWKTTSCFSTLYPKVSIDLVAGNTDQAVTPDQHIIANNTGSVVWTVPTTQLSAYNQDYSGGPYTLTNFNNQAQFRFLIEGYPPLGRSEGPLDYSDNRFTIKAAAVSTALPQYVGTHADCGGPLQCWPPIITTSSQSYSCNNIGVAPNTEGNDVTAQRVINGRTYCIHSLSDGYAGGRGYTYTYTTSNGSGIKIATFGLLFPSCGVYGGPTDPTVIQCNSNQTTFKNNLDVLIDSLM
jgi:hypothetical protein